MWRYVSLFVISRNTRMGHQNNWKRKESGRKLCFGFLPDDRINNILWFENFAPNFVKKLKKLTSKNLNSGYFHFAYRK